MGSVATTQADQPDLPEAQTVLAPVELEGRPTSTKAGIDSVINTSRPGVGADPALMVSDLASGSVLDDIDGNEPQLPASVAKILTAAAALSTFGPDHRLETTVSFDAGSGQMTLTGGGDPQLASVPSDPRQSSLWSLAKKTVSAMSKRDRRASWRVTYDGRGFRGPQVSPYWGAGFVGLEVSRISALSVNGGFGSVDPALSAATIFADQLRSRGVTVSSVSRAEGQSSGSVVAVEESLPMAELVEHMLTLSDNTEAEMLAHLVGGKALNDPTFRGGARATEQALREQGVPTDGLVLKDGSGLGSANRVAPKTFLAVLEKSAKAERETWWPVFTGLPVAGFDGTLGLRFDDRRTRGARGVIRGKTGTLTGAIALAGYVNDRDQRVLAFAALNNETGEILAAKDAMDRLVSGLATCPCNEPTD